MTRRGTAGTPRRGVTHSAKDPSPLHQRTAEAWLHSGPNKAPPERGSGAKFTGQQNWGLPALRVGRMWRQTHRLNAETASSVAQRRGDASAPAGGRAPPSPVTRSRASETNRDPARLYTISRRVFVSASRRTELSPAEAGLSCAEEACRRRSEPHQDMRVNQGDGHRKSAASHGQNVEPIRWFLCRKSDTARRKKAPPRERGLKWGSSFLAFLKGLAALAEPASQAR
jgi:hypothetical protein